MIVYVVLRYDEHNHAVVWKVYDTEEKAQDACKALTESCKYRFKYEDWMVR